jgi:predicted RNase H-like nuclease
LFYFLILNTTLLLQGLILSNALRAQKNAEDEGCTIALNNLRSEVIELRNKGLEKDKILKSLVNVLLPKLTETPVITGKIIGKKQL